MLKQLLKGSLVYVKDADGSEINLNQFYVNEQHVFFTSQNSEISVSFTVKEKEDYLTLAICK